MIATDLAHALDRALWARDALAFEPDPWQERVLRWAGQRLLLNCCRQSGKSTVAALLALHEALYSPGSLALLVSPSLRQSGELFRKVRDALRALPQPPDLEEDNALSLKLSNGSRVVSLPGSETTVRGYSGVDLIIEDEASRVDDSLHAAVRPMLAASGGRLVLSSTPHGARGHFWEAWTEGDGWERVRVDASECPRISEAFLAEERHAMGEWLFRQEYLCEFVDPDTQLYATADVLAALDPDLAPLFPC